MNRIRLQVFCSVKRFCATKYPTLNLEAKSASSRRQLVSKDPVKSRIDSKKLPSKTSIDADTIALLERLSLVDCANKEGIETLEAAIEFADQIQQVNTEGIEPMFTVLEDIPLRLRQDQVKEDSNKTEVLQNATVIEDDYFVAPPGNIPLATREDLLFEKNHQKQESSPKKESFRS